MRRTTRRWGLSSTVYAADPWAVILSALDRVRTSERSSAESFVRQAREYYQAADRVSAIETRPLLLYYSFMNLAKALALARRRPGVGGRVGHGINLVGGSGDGVATARLVLHASTAASVSAIDELNRAIAGNPLVGGEVAVADLVTQSVVAHRLWADALGRKERFLAVDRIAVMHDAEAKTLWTTVAVRSDRLQRRNYGVRQALHRSGLSADYRSVRAEDGWRLFEQSVPVTYTGRAADKVMDVVAALRPSLWQTVTATSPFRRYYLLLTRTDESRLHQVTSAYALLFWLGSLTRYQPVAFLDLLSSPYGGFFREFLATQPPQLLYLVASEFRQQDVARAAIV